MRRTPWVLMLAARAVMLPAACRLVKIVPRMGEAVTVARSIAMRLFPASMELSAESNDATLNIDVSGGALQALLQHGDNSVAHSDAHVIAEAPTLLHSVGRTGDLRFRAIAVQLLTPAAEAT